MPPGVSQSFELALAFWNSDCPLSRPFGSLPVSLPGRRVGLPVFRIDLQLPWRSWIQIRGRRREMTCIAKGAAELS